MVDRLISVGDDLTLPPSVKATDANLPERLGATQLSATIVEVGGSSFVQQEEYGYDVILLAGQSNTSGRGQGIDTATLDALDQRIYQLPTSGQNAGKIILASEPLQHRDFTTSAGVGIGPGLQFARRYVETLPPGRRVLLVCTAKGSTGFGTPVPDSWDPAATTPNLYDSAVRATASALALGGPGSRLVAALWVQGEADNWMTTSAYAAKLDALIDGFRTRLNAPDLPFIIGRMTPEFIAASAGNANIDAAHTQTPLRRKRVAVTTGPAGQSIDNGLHYNGVAQRQIGEDMFRALPIALAHTVAGAQSPGRVPVVSVSGSVVTWQATASGGSPITGYRIFRGTSSETMAQIGSVGAGVYSFTDTGAPDIALYGVIAVNEIGVGVMSRTAVKGGLTFPPGPSADNFNRTDADTLGVTSVGTIPWETRGTWGIRSNQAALLTAASGGQSTAFVDAGSPDASVSAKFYTSDGSAGLAFRVQDNGNLFMITSNGSLFRIDNHAATGIGWSTGGWGTPSVAASGEEVKVVSAGTTHSIYRAGALVGTLVASQFASATRFGLRSSNTANRFDDFAVTVP